MFPANPVYGSASNVSAERDQYLARDKEFGFVAEPGSDWARVLQAFKDLETSGGTIVLPPGNINVTARVTVNNGLSTGLIPVSHGIKYVGAGIAFNNQGAFDANKSTSLINSTGIRQPMVQWNGIDKASPYSGHTEMNSKWLLNGGMSGLVIQGGDYGIKIGALNEAGARDFILEDVFCYDNTLQGMWFENCEGVYITRPYCYENRHGFAFVASGGTVWNYGNSTIVRPKCFGHRTVNGDSRNGRGFALLARNGSQLNDVYVYDMQGGGTGDADLNVVNMSMTNGVADISVPDVSLFERGMIIIPQASAGGFLTNTSRIVSSVSGTSGAGTIRLCNSLGGQTASNGNGGTVLTPTATTTLNVAVRGFAPVEFGGLDFNSYVAACGMVGKVDIEAGGACDVLVRDTRGFTFETNVLSLGTAVAHVICRNNFNQQVKWKNDSGNTGLDADGAIFYSGIVNGFTTLSKPIGILQNGSNARGILNLGATAGGQDLFSDGSANGVIKWNASQILSIGNASAGTALANNIGTVIKFTGVGGANNLQDLGTANFDGVLTVLINLTANSFTINSLNAQQIYTAGVGALSFVLGPRESAILFGVRDGSAGAWYRIT